MKDTFHDPRLPNSTERLVPLASGTVAVAAIGGLIGANLPAAAAVAGLWDRTLSVAFGGEYASGPLRWWVTAAVLPAVCLIGVLFARRLGCRVRYDRSAWPAFIVSVSWVVLLLWAAAARSSPPSSGPDAANATVAFLIMMSLNRARVGLLWPYVAAACVLFWFARTVDPVVHAAVIGGSLPLAGVRNELTFMFRIDAALDRFETAHGPARLLDQDDSLCTIADAANEELPPAHRVERSLSPVIAVVLLPMFVLANAGVAVADLSRVQAQTLAVPAAGTASLVIAMYFAVRQLGGQQHAAWSAAALGFAMSLGVSASLAADDARRLTVVAGIWVGALLGALLNHGIRLLAQHGARNTAPARVLHFRGR